MCLYNSPFVQINWLSWLYLLYYKCNRLTRCCFFSSPEHKIPRVSDMTRGRQEVAIDQLQQQHQNGQLQNIFSETTRPKGIFDPNLMFEYINSVWVMMYMPIKHLHVVAFIQLQQVSATGPSWPSCLL